MKRLATALLALTLLAGPAAANTFIHNGRLLDGQDEPVTATVEMSFTLYRYESAPPSGSGLQDEQFWTSTRPVTVSRGVYSATIGGDAQPLPEAALGAGVFFLGVKVNGSEMQPRLRVAPVPFALRASEAKALKGGPVDATEVKVAGKLVIDANGRFQGPTDNLNVTKSWNDLTDVPPGLKNADYYSKAEVDAKSAGVAQDVSALGEALNAEKAKIGDAAALDRGIVPDARLPQGLARTGSDQTFTGRNTFDNANNLFRGSFNGLVRLAQTSATCDATLEGMMRYENRGVEFCDGRAWKPIYTPPRDGALQAQAALSCKAIRDAGFTGTSGSRWLDPDGGATDNAFQSWCDFSTAEGGWTLLFNLATRDGVAHTWEDTAFWQGTSIEGDAASALTTGYKSRAFSTLSGFKEVMIRLHNANSSQHGYALYDVQAAYLNRSFQGILTAGNDVVFTNPRKAATGGVATTLNEKRGQTLHGDIFVSHPEALVANKTSGWAAARNTNRLATTLSNNDYVHTTAGLGGWHEQGAGAYITKYEALPISPYCAVKYAYGSSASFTTGNASTNAIFVSGCLGTNEGTSFEYLPVDVAVYVR